MRKSGYLSLFFLPKMQPKFDFKNIVLYISYYVDIIKFIRYIWYNRVINTKIGFWLHGIYPSQLRQTSTGPLGNSKGLETRSKPRPSSISATLPQWQKRCLNRPTKEACLAWSRVGLLQRLRPWLVKRLEARVWDAFWFPAVRGRRLMRICYLVR